MIEKFAAGRGMVSLATGLHCHFFMLTPLRFRSGRAARICRLGLSAQDKGPDDVHPTP